MKKLTVMAALAVAATVLALPTATPAFAAPAVTVTPSTDLTNGQSVTVAGSGYQPDTDVFLLQCSSAPSRESCDTAGLKQVRTTSSGSFSAAFSVKTGAVGNGRCDAGSSNCLIAASHPGSAPATAGLRFRAAGPSVTVTPSTDLTDRQSVTVAGTGYQPDTDVFVLQCSSAPSRESCDTAGLKQVRTTTSGTFSTAFTVKTGVVGNGRCDAGSSNCLIAASHPGSAPSTASLRFAAAPSATATATTSPSATSTATPTSTTSPTPTSTTSPTPAAPGCGDSLDIELDRNFIVPGVPVQVSVTGAPNAVVQLKAYSRPSAEYRVVRTAPVNSSGTLTFDVAPGTNTRLFAECTSGGTTVASTSLVINVRTAISLTVVRNGVRDYTFKGRVLPRRANQLVTLYRVVDDEDETRVLTSQVRTDGTGTYRINRTFLGSGTFGFLARTGQNLTNAAGESGLDTTDDVSLVDGAGTPRPTAIF